MRIVIVEDEIKIRTGLSRLISTHTKHQIAGEAKNGQEGLEIILKTRPDLVISDIKMPVMDGLTMLQKLEQEDIKVHTIILSGYSEFEYAQKAIKYGVAEYLLKPLAPEDVSEVLEKIEQLLEKEKQKKAETVEGILRDILLGGRIVTEEECKKLMQVGGFLEQVPFYFLRAYVGDTDPRYVSAVEKRWEKLKEQYPEFRFHYTMLLNTQEMFCMFQSELSRQEILEKLKRRIYMDLSKDDRPVWIFEKATQLQDMQQMAEAMRELYLYAVHLGYREILTQEKAKECIFTEFRYPKEIEANFQQSICGNSPEKLKKTTEKFIAYMQGVKIAPFEYHRTYRNMIHFIENIGSEVDKGLEKAIREMKPENKIANAVTLSEMEQVLLELIQLIVARKDKKEDIRNYVISRAIAYIREHYKENISLEFLADRLDITPEYLSTLFNKEVGINFSVFLKRFRISQAKRLLTGTDLKVYEIAAEVGYNDPKYFNRVFKEENGVSPKEYRQLY